MQQSAGADDDPIRRVAALLAKSVRARKLGEHRHQVGRRSVVSPCLDARAEVVQHLLALPSARVHHRQDSFHEPAALRTVCAAADLPPQHSMPLRSLCLIVRRFDSFYVHERPQPLLVLEQLLARPDRFLAPALLAELIRTIGPRTWIA